MTLPTKKGRYISSAVMEIMCCNLYVKHHVSNLSFNYDSFNKRLHYSKHIRLVICHLLCHTIFLV